MSSEFSSDWLAENNKRKWNNSSASSFINDRVNTIQNKY